ncbi:MAG: class I SAM-dependent methyltransferase [Candidatus Bathyarchaeota archaeon]|nr:class I SAM-dependent methyltransferase [Candidatus Bathyarchaeota archaeon]
MKQQSDKSQKGEIEFRRKLSKQQISGECFFEDEYDAEGIERILSDRMKKTYDHMVSLKAQNIALSPYLEIGAERCQRSLVMENDLEANGAAVDISFDMLKSCDHYKAAFNKGKVPLRICCDANNMPFMSNSVPFVFCYETLHHFPDPSPIVKEIHRVLSPGGYFSFNEEPFKKVLHINLYNAEKAYANKQSRRGKLRKIKTMLDIFFARKTCNEVDHDIIENLDITIKTWKRTIELFEEKNVNLHSNAITKTVNTEMFHPKNRGNYMLAYLFGGEISGVCHKAGHLNAKIKPIEEVLICPSCLKEGNESRLAPKNSALHCEKCNNTYPIHGGVAFLFSPEKLKELYPEISAITGTGISS